jgi:hypothetical protein
MPTTPAAHRTPGEDALQAPSLLQQSRPFAMNLGCYGVMPASLQMDFDLFE